MNVPEIEKYILIGFNSPSLYKRSVWRQTEQIMEWLVANSKGVIVKSNGTEKYVAKVNPLFRHQLHLWACAYKKAQGEDILLSDAINTMTELAKYHHVNPRSGKAIQLYRSLKIYTPSEYQQEVNKLKF